MGIDSSVFCIFDFLEVLHGRLLVLCCVLCRICLCDANAKSSNSKIPCFSDILDVAAAVFNAKCANLPEGSAW